MAKPRHCARRNLLSCMDRMRRDATAGRGFEVEGASPSVAHITDYSHPYYWAPFVLIGNYH